LTVDAVITWVDGQDEAHIAKRLNYFSKRGIQASTTEIAERLHSANEIEYCLKAMLRFAPWLNRIYLVTDAQAPKALETIPDPRIQVIDHKVIFRDYESYLPTFNSLTIESLLWRIPDLSEKFIYFNDDCMLLRPLTEEAFFYECKPVLRGQFKLQSRYQPWKLKKIAPHRHLEEKTAQMLGFRLRFYALPHMPFPLLKSSFEHYFSEHEAELQGNLKYPLRSSKQFWSVSLFYHLIQQSKLGIHVCDLKAMSVHARLHSFSKVQKRFARMMEDESIAFACIQDLSQATPEVYGYITEWLANHLECAT